MNSQSLCTFLGCIFAICSSSSLVSAQQTPFQPECVAWDRMIRIITKNVRAIPTASAKCSRSSDCTRFACKFLMLRKDIIFDIKLYPCTTPAQMRLLVLSNTDNVYFEQTVMNGNIYPIPGLTYNIFPGMRLQISVKVHFRKLPSGLEIGLRLKLSGPTPLITFSYPIFPDIIIPARECRTVLPFQRHCNEMNSTISNISFPVNHACSMVDGCGGLQCAGRMVPPVATQRPMNLDYDVSLVMDGCDSPLSYTIVISPGANYHWQYKFFRSKNVTVDLQLPYSTLMYVELLMEPDLSLETMITSLTLRGCFARLPHCSSIQLLVQAAIPIPPCSATAPTGHSPTVSTTPQQDACQVWQSVESELIQSAGPGYGLTECSTIENCSGYNCIGEFEGHNYTVVTVLKHCRDPVALRMRVRSITDRFFWEKSVTHNDNITVEGTSGMLGFHIHLLKLSPSQVLVGVYAQVGLPGLSPLSVPLIQDRIMPVSKCPGLTNGIPGPGRGNTNGGRRPPGSPQNPRRGRPTKSPVQNIKMRTGASVGIGLTIGVGIAALVATVMIYIYYRRFPSPDRVILVHRPTPPTTVRTL